MTTTKMATHQNFGDEVHRLGTFDARGGGQRGVRDVLEPGVALHEGVRVSPAHQHALKEVDASAAA